MIIKASINSESKLMSFVGDEFRHCVYLYANLAKYGLNNPNMSMWSIEINATIQAIIQKYFSCMHFFCKKDGWLTDELLALINKEAPRTIFASQGNARLLHSKLIDRYAIKTMNLYSLPVDTKPILGNFPVDIIDQLKEAQEDDIGNIADFLMKDEEYKKNYDRNTLYDQLIERLVDKFSRYYIIRKGSRIIATVSTKAEHASFAVIGGVMVAKDYRGCAIGKCITYDVTKILQKEGKETFSFVSEYNFASIAMFQQVGYNHVGVTGKLTAL